MSIWCRIANGVRMQFSGSPFEMKLNKNEKEEAVTEEGKRRHNLSLLYYDLFVWTSFSVPKSNIMLSVCALDLLLCTTQSHVERYEKIYLIIGGMHLLALAAHSHINQKRKNRQKSRTQTDSVFQ